MGATVIDENAAGGPQPASAGPAGIAYGLELHGTALGNGLLPTGEHCFPTVQVSQQHVAPPDGESFADPHHARIHLADGRRTVTLDHDPGTAVFCGPKLSGDELVHPYLAPVASVFARWHRREAFHAGALVTGAGAWALLGANEAGKSTLLAAHAARGGEVLADDLVVVDDLQAFAGPRCIDLCAALPDPAGENLPLTRSRQQSRWRATLKEIEPAVVMRGWVFLSWTDTHRPELEPITSAECLRRLAPSRAWHQLASDPARILKLAALPAYTLGRPRDWRQLPDTIEKLTDTLEHADSVAGRG